MTPTPAPARGQALRRAAAMIALAAAVTAAPGAATDTQAADRLTGIGEHRHSELWTCRASGAGRNPADGEIRLSADLDTGEGAIEFGTGVTTTRFLTKGILRIWRWGDGEDQYQFAVSPDGLATYSATTVTTAPTQHWHCGEVAETPE